MARALNVMKHLVMNIKIKRPNTHVNIFNCSS